MTVLDVEKLVAANQGRQGSQCQACLWIASRSTEEQALWDKAMAEKRWHHAAIHRAIISVEPDDLLRPRRGSIENHRAQGHRK